MSRGTMDGSEMVFRHKETLGAWYERCLSDLAQQSGRSREEIIAHWLAAGIAHAQPLVAGMAAWCGWPNRRSVIILDSLAVANELGNAEPPCEATWVRFFSQAHMVEVVFPPEFQLTPHSIMLAPTIDTQSGRNQVWAGVVARINGQLDLVEQYFTDQIDNPYVALALQAAFATRSGTVRLTNPLSTKQVRRLRSGVGRLSTDTVTRRLSLAPNARSTWIDSSSGGDSSASGNTGANTGCPMRRHWVRDHCAIVWVLEPRPGEVVLSAKMRNEKAPLYAVRRLRQGHDRGSVESEAPQIVLQPNSGRVA